MSLFSDLKPHAHLSRNVFDLSKSETFSCKLGMLTPCFVQHTIPRGHYRINMSDIVRVSEQQTANFVGMSQNVEFAFIPYSQLWHDFNRMYYGKGELTRFPVVDIILGQNKPVPKNVPTANFKPVVLDIFRACMVAHWWKAQYAKLLEYDSRFVPYDEHIQLLKNEGVVSNGASFFLQQHIDIHNRFCGFDQLRLLDMLGYGNYLPLLKYQLHDFSLAQNPSEVVNVFNTSVVPDMTQRINALSASIPDGAYNLFALLAYIKFYNDIYRNRIYDDNPYYQLYNVDWAIDTSSSITPAISTEQLLYMLKPYYRQYKKDLFTGLYPNPQFGDVSLVANISNISSVRIQSYTSSTGNLSVADNGLLLKDTESRWDLRLNNYPVQVSALAVRQAEALQRLKEKLVRAGNRESDLQKAIFGVDSKYIEDSYVDFLGSFQSMILMNPVAATSSQPTTEQNLADLGAYSVGSIEMGSSKDIEFEAHDFGIILGLVYVLPETKYESYGVDPHNLKFSQGDYYQPQMQNLGLSPVHSYYNNMFGLALQAPVERVLGYLSRYWEYKTAISRVHGEFYGSNPCFSYDEFNKPDVRRASSVGSAFGAFSDFVAPRDVRETSMGTLQMLYVNPADADRIFYISEDMYQLSDHFKFEMSFRVKAVLPMSVVGLPD